MFMVFRLHLLFSATKMLFLLGSEMNKIKYFLLLTILWISSGFALQPQSILDKRTNTLSQYNQGYPISNLNWPSKKIRLSGFTNVDIHPKTMQKTLAGEENDYFALSNIGLNIDSDLSQLFHAHVGVAYFKTNKGQGDRIKNTDLMLDDAYLTYSDFSQAPWFVEIGRFYLPFGQYNRYAIVPTLAQILTMARETGVQVGTIDWEGITGSMYISQGALKRNNKRIQGNLNGGAALHYHHRFKNKFHAKAGLQYIYNMLDTNAISESDPFQTSNNSATPLFPTANDVYSSRTGGIATQATIGYRWVNVYGQYVTALSKSSNILRKYTSPSSRSGAAIMDAKPSAWDAGFKFNFNSFKKCSEFDFTYSRSDDTAGLFIFNSTRNHAMPHARYIWGYSIDWTQYLLTRLQWAHDWLYPQGHGDTGRQGDDITLRVGVKL